MAEVRAFRALRYSAEAGALPSLVAPPYDVLTPAERDAFGARSPRNVVHLTLPESRADDRSKFVKYARSAALLAEWRREGVLVPEDAPTLYRLEQSFGLPREGESYTRTTLVALIKVEPYERGVVLPHEQTFPKHKEDRMRLLEATRAHLESIFGLYEDPEGLILAAIRGAPVGAPVEVRTDDGVRHRLAPLSTHEEIVRVIGLLADRKVWIADGHHRYETALAFRERLGERDRPIPEDYMMMALGSLSDPGLVLLPTHRIVRTMPLSGVQAIARLETLFDVRETHSSRLTETLEARKREGKRAFGMAIEGGLGYVLTPKDDRALVESVEAPGSAELRGLDVTILHSVILERLLGVRGLDAVEYTRDPLEAIRETDFGSSAAAFLMNPPSVEDMKRIALGGEKMPQKSTFYFPKILSGLTLWSLDDF